MDINIHEKNNGVGIQMFDGLYAYRQSLDSEYKSDWNITITDTCQPADLNILFEYMPQEDTQVDHYDLVFFCNDCEPLMDASRRMKELYSNDNVYLITNSYLTSDHPLFDKVIWTPNQISICKTYWTQKFYPHYYESKRHEALPRQPTLAYINGLNRTVRHYFSELLAESKLEIDQRLTYPDIANTPHSQWESAADQEFRSWLEDKYYNQWSMSQHDNYTYYNNQTSIGIGQKFGETPPGYVILPMYYTNSCIAYPETGWQNNELTITEKTLKCFYAGSLPFVIGGSNLNKLLNDLGFATAWNLLPKEHQTFDQEENHKLRYHQIVSALEWLQDNLQVFESDEFIQLTNQNKSVLLESKFEYNPVVKLSSIIEKYI